MWTPFDVKHIGQDGVKEMMERALKQVEGALMEARLNYVMDPSNAMRDRVNDLTLKLTRLEAEHNEFLSEKGPATP